MSFRWFVYYCSLCGGCAAYLGWAFGRLPGVQHHVAQASFKGMFLGLMLGMGLSTLDAARNLGWTRAWGVGVRVLFGGLMGGVGGFVGGMFGQVLYAWTQWQLFLILGWTLTGLLIGASPGIFDLLGRLAGNEDIGGTLGKVAKGITGGALGGLLGGLLFLVLRSGWERMLGERADAFWSPSATGFVVLGLCIGLLIGLAQVFLVEAWVRVESGFRAGRELILEKTDWTIGRAESCDLGLFGDAAIEKLHARIVLQDGRYLLIDAGTPGGTWLNGERIEGSAALRTGDEIGIGRARLVFRQRRKRGEKG